MLQKRKRITNVFMDRIYIFNQQERIWAKITSSGIHFITTIKKERKRIWNKEELGQRIREFLSPPPPPALFGFIFFLTAGLSLLSHPISCLAVTFTTQQINS